MSDRYDKRYYKTDAWRELCSLVFISDGGRCVLCGRDGKQFHHRSYRHFGEGAYSEEIKDVHTLCKGCHKLFHDNKKVVSGHKWNSSDLEEISPGVFAKKQ